MTGQQRYPCRGCHAEVVWAVTANGKAMAVDPQPVDGGNVYLYDDDRGVAHADVLGPLELTITAGPLYRSHFATCPVADEYRQPKGGTP